jgi:hypothetical protein
MLEDAPKNDAADGLPTSSMSAYAADERTKKYEVGLQSSCSSKRTS